MKRILILLAILLAIIALAMPFPSLTTAAGPEWVVVNAGDTLFAIASRYGITVEALVRANNLPNANFVYSGQRLLVPDPLMQFPPQQQEQQQQQQQQQQVQPVQNAPAVQPAVAASNVYYTVRPGDTLAGIAARYGVSVAAIAQANNLTNWNFVWYGQRLRIPGTTSVGGVAPAAPQPVQPQTAAQPAVNAPTDGKWIDVDVTKQTITAYEGTVAIKSILVSTGLPRTPTVIGTYKILRKYPAVRMTGGTPGYDYYDLPNVPWTMFFFQGYAIHGTYWHTNFGHPMSHGCVNLPKDEAKWFYDWAPVGTTVVTHK